MPRISDHKRAARPPKVYIDDQLHVIRKVKSAVEWNCVAQGSLLNRTGDHEFNVMSIPLMGISDQMRMLVSSVERWAFRVKYLMHVEENLTRVYESQKMSRTEKFTIIIRRIARCRPFDDSYCIEFNLIQQRLDYVINALNDLMSFVSAICIERDESPNDQPAAHSCASSSQTITEETMADAPNSASETTASSQPTNAASPDSENELPWWKAQIALKHDIRNLHIGKFELDLFAKLLSEVRDTRNEVLTAHQLTTTYGKLAHEKQSVFKMWAARCSAYENVRDKSNVSKESEEQMVGYAIKQSLADQRLTKQRSTKQSSTKLNPGAIERMTEEEMLELAIRASLADQNQSGACDETERSEHGKGKNREDDEIARPGSKEGRARADSAPASS